MSKTTPASDGRITIYPKDEKYLAMNDDELEAVAQELIAQLKSMLALTRAVELAADKAAVDKALATASPSERLRLALAGSRAGHNGVR